MSGRDNSILNYFGQSRTNKRGQDSSSECQETDACSKRKVEKRDIKSEWFTKFRWLEHEREKSRFFCTWCIQAGKNNVFTRGKSVTIPKIDDLKKHEQTSDHKSALLARDCAKKAEWQKANAKVHESVKGAIVATMKNVFFLAKEDIAKEKLASLQNHVLIQVCAQNHNLSA